MKFNEVIGQDNIKRQLMQLVAEERVPHAMLLCGPAGCGKMAVTLAFASFLLGERDANDPFEANAMKVLPKLGVDRTRNV